MINRNLVTAIQLLADKYPILALTGPRQSGKTTLLKEMFTDYRYVSLENPDNRNFAETDPNGFLEMYDQKVIFDEVQQVPQLFSYLQTIVDEKNIMGQFILSGSQNFHLMERITQSLAGRVAIFKLFPFDFSELSAEGLLDEDYIVNMLKGFYPAIYDRNIPSKTFYSNYLQTYVQRDVTDLIAIKDLKLFQNFLSLCASRAGQLLNQSSLANEAGITHPTAKAWLSALENSYIVFQLQPYHENFSKRIVKSPKIYFYDTGLLCHLLNIREPKQLHLHPLKGSLFENMIIAEYVKRMYHKNDINDVWFWRDFTGKEVDLLAFEKDITRLFEIKATQTIMADLFNGLDYVGKLFNKSPISKYLVYGGKEVQQRSYGNVIPWAKFP